MKHNGLFKEQYKAFQAIKQKYTYYIVFLIIQKDENTSFQTKRTILLKTETPSVATRDST